MNPSEAHNIKRPLCTKAIYFASVAHITYRSCFFHARVIAALFRYLISFSCFHFTWRMFKLKPWVFFWLHYYEGNFRTRSVDGAYLLLLTDTLLTLLFLSSKGNNKNSNNKNNDDGDDDDDDGDDYYDDDDDNDGWWRMLVMIMKMDNVDNDDGWR